MTAPGDELHDDDPAPLSNNNNGASSVQVAVRVRPMLPHEAGNTQCIEVLKSSSSPSSVAELIRLGGEAGPKFTFDQIFPLTTSQHDVYRHRVAPLVASCLEGYNATILAYGQTGSGKTHTIMGPSSSITTAIQDERQAGVIPRAIRSIFEQLEGWGGKSDREASSGDLDEEVSNQKNSHSEDEKSTSSSSSTYEYDVRVQFLEVYGQEIRDLLTTTQQTSKKLSIRDVGLAEPEVVGASEVKVESAEEALLCLTRGMYRRVTGATAMNETSSRSHAIFSLIVEQSTVIDQIGETPAKARSGEEGGDDPIQRHVQAKRSKFNFVDLAGSERQKRTQASGQRLKEGININQGLLVLGNVISALGDPKKQGKTFVPYRDSNLTRLLKGSLGGNHKTLMIACVSPASNNLEETLNCLRYANRAKNIQNHAVVNVDATSRVVSELRTKMQLLASDLLKARDGNLDSLSMPLEVIQSLAKGGDGEALSAHTPFSSTPLQMRTNTPYAKENTMPTPLNIHADLELQHLKAENESYRIKFESLTNGKGDPTEALQKAFTARAAEYEREIAVLRNSSGSLITPASDSGIQPLDFEKATIRGGELSGIPILPPRTPSRLTSPRSESPELSRLRAQMFGSMAQSKNLDAEVEAEEKAVVDLTTKYLGRIGEEDDEGDHTFQEPETTETDEDDTVRLQAEMFELSTSISAKEELIQKLQVSQEKYEAMREFYQEKLREMEILLAEKEHETEKLSEELSKLDKDHSGTHELADRLKQKQQQVAELKRKQAELTRLTTVASKNESQIAKLSNEVSNMKHKKVELQKQMTAERKSHAIEVQKLKKESMQQQRELNKVKQMKDKKAMEAEKAQQMAKTRLEQVYQLKSKYKESEKRLRILTVKRGVMSRAGLDPVMVGRRQSKTNQSKKSQSASDQQNEETINLDGLRDFFDQKVADVGRREALAEKLAQEWEEHLDLSSQREELVQNTSEDTRESLDSLDSRIKYKEDRIRQLAARLGKPKKASENETTDDHQAFLFTEDFKKHVGNASPMLSTQLAAKVLFGMVVRERRRIAALARTASALDEKVQEAEAAVAAKDSAFRAYVDEQRLEAAELAQNQQQHILSLMDMVREDPENGETAADLSSPVRSAKARHAEKANSKLLLLANERIAVLERQLHETQLGREAIQQHRDRENEAHALLEEKASECEGLEEELNDLRTAMRRIREEVVVHDDFSVVDEASEEAHKFSKKILEIIVNSLHPKSHPGDSSSKRRRRSGGLSFTPSSKSLSIRRETEFVHTSDSDEVPDWADDIMKDLEIIAKGEMPTSLMESPGVIHAEAQLENQSVFDRLNNPESFTGVQKQKKKSQRVKKARNTAEPATDGQRQRKMISKQVAHSLDKLVVPGNPSAPDSVRRASRDSEKDDVRSRSVFDRLLSPSNLTGTQRQRFQEKKGKRDSGKTSDEQSRGGDEAVEIIPSTDQFDHDEADGVLHDILNDSDGSDSKMKGHSTGGKSESSRKRDEYKGLDVFERLNKTTTQAYAVKQHVNIAEKMLDDLLEESEWESEKHAERHDDPKSEFHTDRVDEYTQQDVFARLQKTTTKAYAVKHEQHENSATSLDAVSPKANVNAFSIATGSFSKDPGELLDDLLDGSTNNGEVDDMSDVVRSPIRSRLRPRK